MNIAKLQAQLQHVPDQALIGYVQNPDGQVPSYLALAEINRRSEIRKNSAPTAAAPQQTVAQQAVASVEPGVAGLPVREDMYNEKSMATGGIVAFDEGGYVPKYADGDLINSYQEYQRYLADPNRATTSMSGLQPLRMSEEEFAYRKAKEDELNRLYSVTGEGGRFGARGRAPSAPIAPEPGMFTAITPAQREAYRQREALINRFKQGEFDPRAQKVTAATTSPAAQDQAEKPPVPTRDAAVRTPGGAGAPAGTPVAGSRLPGGVADLYTKPTDLSGEYAGLMRPEDSARTGMDKFLGLIGEDKSRLAVQERLKGMEAKAAKDEAQAPWMALAEAGLGMASGTSPFALKNIAEGGARGIKSLADAKERQVKAEERHFDMANKLAQAERAEQTAAATYGLQSEERAKAHNDTVKQAQLTYKAERENTIANKEFDAKKFKLEYAQKDREIEIMASKVDKQIAAAETQSKRFELQNARDSIKATLSNITDLLKVETNPANQAQLYKAFNDNVLKLNNLATYGSVGGASNPAPGKLPPAVENAMKAYNK